MFAHMVGKTVVLLLFEVFDALCTGHGALRFKGFKQIVDDGLVVEYAVDVGADAIFVDEYLFGCGALSLVYLITMTCVSVEIECDLACGFGGEHCGLDGQECQTGQIGNAALDAVGVCYHFAQHLITAADAYDGFAVAMSPLYGCGTTVAAQFYKVVDCGFCAGQDDDVRVFQIGCVVGVKEVDPRVALQCVEVCVVADMAQQHYSYVHLALGELTVFLCQCYTIFFFDVNVFVVRYHTQNGYSAYVLHHLSAFCEQTHVATELIDDDAFDESAVFLCLKCYAAIYTCKHTATVYVANQYDVGFCMSSHRQVYQISVAQINLCYTACTLHYDGVVAGREAVEGFAYLSAEIYLRTALAPVVVCVLVADRLSVEDYLRCVVALWFQQQRIHVRLTGYACCLSLYGLCATYLQSVGGDITVQSHVLCFEWCGLVTVLTEYAAKGSCDDALAYVAACSGKHYGVEW